MGKGLAPARLGVEATTVPSGATNWANPSPGPAASTGRLNRVMSFAGSRSCFLGFGTSSSVRSVLTLPRMIVSLPPGRRINLEPAVGLDDRFGGHLITGHVDGLGTIRARRPRTGDTLLWIAAPAGIMTRMVERGSVAVDGISLTVVSLLREAFTVALIPHTLQATALARKRIGQRVNLESDLIVKAVQRWLDPALSRGRSCIENLCALTGCPENSGPALSPS